MTIESSAPSPSAPQPGGMPVTIGAQYIKDFSFENPNAPLVYGSQEPPSIAMQVNIFTRSLAPNTYEVLLSLKIDAKQQDKTAFISELVYGGVFSLPQLPEDQMKLFLLVEAPRLLFPFARGIMTTAMRDAGFPQVIISPIDFYSLYLANKDKVGTMPAVGAA